MLMLHRGAEAIDFDTLTALSTPDATKSHVPIRHTDVVDMVKYALGYYGHAVVEEHHAIAEEGHRYFGLLQLKSQYGDYTDTVGLRNSHDKSFPVGIAFGSQVFVCDNLAFTADHVVKRRHTANLKRDLPGIVAEIVEPLQQVRKLQHEKIERYRETPLLDHQADHIIMELYRHGVINLQRIAEVNRQYHEPDYDWGQRTAWRMFNATTVTLTGRVAEKPAVTAKLHEVIDGVCEIVT